MKIAFIDHSFHKKTKSSNFFIELLIKNGLQVECLWDDSWCGGEPVVFDKIASDYEAFIFWQQVPQTSVKFFQTNANIIYIPMLDNFGSDRELHWNRNHWRNFAGTKVLSFSKALYNAFLGQGVASMYTAYYPDPSEYEANFDLEKNNAFFWQRRPDQINWDIIKDYIDEKDFDSIHIHMAEDPGFKNQKPSNKDILKYNITLSEWFADKSEYKNLLKQTQVYFTPRKSEGIGLSFLEAMAMGKCVAAPNYGTMNEYIINGMNGILYELDYPGKISFSKNKTLEICKRARESVEIGFESWKKRESEIIDFIISKPEQIYKKYYNVNIDYSELMIDITGNNHQEVNSNTTLQRLKRKVASSKLGPILYPAWRNYKKIKNRKNLTQLASVENVSLKAIDNFTLTPPSLSPTNTCGRYLFANREGLLLEGGLRLDGKYKASVPEKPLVTIITVVYNCSAKIERAIQSVLSQTYDNIEYIIVDGGSTDGTLDIIKKYGESIDYYISQKDNGIYDAMNKGISLSHGDFIGIVNADDMLFNDGIEVSIKEIVANNADYSAAEDYCVDENGNFIGVFKVMHLDERSLVAKHPCNHGAMLIGKNVYNEVGYYDLKYKIGADYKLQLAIVTNKRFKGCKIFKSVHYFEMAGVSSQQRVKALEDVQNIIMEFLPNIDSQIIHSLVYFMHEHYWNEKICKDLEQVIESGVFNTLQIDFLLENMKVHGYTGKYLVENHIIQKEVLIKKLTFKKIIKYSLPHGIVEIYKKRKLK
ncbi:glycosyltransferase [Paenibacillus validus]|uniref:Glycosyltransferase n=1 Tax=Paenibacillus validus TaxID=44253 RepID=A0A7X2ZFG2_9BACL|nr:glycosyltransferase [Paenibacillus validus]MUG73949.1 glycosyltransferase [Paenibacillus validus]